MKSQTTTRCEPGDRVRILTSNKAEDPNTYAVQKKDRYLLHLLCESTQRVIKVHVSRVVTNLDKTEEATAMKNDSTVNENTTTPDEATATPASAKTKVTPTKKTTTKVEKVPSAPKAKAKPKRVRVEFKALLESCGEGAERWSKKVNFDHEAMEVRANVVINGDHRSFVTFNTYDGSLGRKAGSEPLTFDNIGSKYDLADDAAFEKKVARLKADGYTGPHRAKD